MRPAATKVAEQMRQYALGLTEDATILAEMVDPSGDEQRINASPWDTEAAARFHQKPNQPDYPPIISCSRLI